MTVRFFYPVQLHPLYIIRCKSNRFLYYLSVYVKSFKELFLHALSESEFLKSECKSTNYFENHQIFRGKSFKKNAFLTRIHILRRLGGQNSLYYTCTRLRGRGRTHTPALIHAYYNKNHGRLASTSICLIQQQFFTNYFPTHFSIHHAAATPCLGKNSRLPKKKFFSGQGEMKVVLGMMIQRRAAVDTFT